MPDKCEDCNDKWASCGEEGGTKRQWCGPCAKRHGGVLLGKQKMCEDCGGKWANYGEEGGTERRWCARVSNQDMS